MIIPVIRDLAQKFSKRQLDEAAEAFELQRENRLEVAGKDEGEILTNLLIAANVRDRMDQGLAIQDALREHSRSVQTLLKKRP